MLRLADINNVHAILDGAAFTCTAWVIYQMLGPLEATYRANKDLDSLRLVWLVAPCAILSFIVYPAGKYSFIMKALWAFALYTEAVSNLPQLYMYQNARFVELKGTGNYFFCLALSRYLCLAHWVLQVSPLPPRALLPSTAQASRCPNCAILPLSSQLVDRKGTLLYALGKGPWAAVVLVAEVLQTVILWDFVWMYLGAVASGSRVVRIDTMPLGIV